MSIQILKICISEKSLWKSGLYWKQGRLIFGTLKKLNYSQKCPRKYRKYSPLLKSINMYFSINSFFKIVYLTNILTLFDLFKNYFIISRLEVTQNRYWKTEVRTSLSRLGPHKISVISFIFIQSLSRGYSLNWPRPSNFFKKSFESIPNLQPVL